MAQPAGTAFALGAAQYVGSSQAKAAPADLECPPKPPARECVKVSSVAGGFYKERPLARFSPLAGPPFKSPPLPLFPHSLRK